MESKRDSGGRSNPSGGYSLGNSSTGSDVPGVASTKEALNQSHNCGDDNSESPSSTGQQRVVLPKITIAEGEYGSAHTLDSWSQTGNNRVNLEMASHGASSASSFRQQDDNVSESRARAAGGWSTAGRRISSGSSASGSSPTSTNRHLGGSTGQQKQKQQSSKPKSGKRAQFVTFDEVVDVNEGQFHGGGEEEEDAEEGRGFGIFSTQEWAEEGPDAEDNVTRMFIHAKVDTAASTLSHTYPPRHWCYPKTAWKHVEYEEDSDEILGLTGVKDVKVPPFNVFLLAFASLVMILVTILMTVYGYAYVQKSNDPCRFINIHGEDLGICSGHGQCFEDRCFCASGFKGEFCTTQSKCPTFNGDVCGGLHRGACVKEGTCSCVPPYTGFHCERKPCPRFYRKECSGLGYCNGTETEEPNCVCHKDKATGYGCQCKINYYSYPTISGYLLDVCNTTNLTTIENKRETCDMNNVANEFCRLASPFKNGISLGYVVAQEVAPMTMSLEGIKCTLDSCPIFRHIACGAPVDWNLECPGSFTSSKLFELADSPAHDKALLLSKPFYQSYFDYNVGTHPIIIQRGGPGIVYYENSDMSGPQRQGDGGH
eukprot:Nk52_evm3s2612 gene=Nk52_evmTU3s2612